MTATLVAPMPELRQRWPAPSRPRPIVIVGAGGIVNEAHLPAYRSGQLPVAGVFDIDPERARVCTERWSLPCSFASLADALSVRDAVFDIAVPPQSLLEIVEQLPEGATALLQKPFGRDLSEATRLRAVCRKRRLTAAVNFQLRFSPMMLALRDVLASGRLGRVVELEVRVQCRTPWELWPFLERLERMEIALHSIHYLDAIRAVLGEPRRVWGRTVRHPDAPRLASSRTAAILDYGDDVRCVMNVHHHHRFGAKHEASEFKVEGTLGAAIAVMGVNLDYPRGRADSLELSGDAGAWESVPLVGRWFPDAFLGTMSNLQRFAAGEDARLETSIEDAWHTMSLVEALYASDRDGGTALPRDEELRS